MLGFLLRKATRRVSFDSRTPFQQTVIRFKNEYKVDPSMLSKNSNQFCEYVVDLICSKKWDYANQIIQIVNINHFGQWKHVRMIAQALKQTLNNDALIQYSSFQLKEKIVTFDERQYIQRLNTSDISDTTHIIQILSKINFQLSHCSAVKSSSQSGQYTLSQHKCFQQRVEAVENAKFCLALFQYLQQRKNTDEKLVLSSYLIKQFPQLFDIQNLQKFIMRHRTTKDIELARVIRRLIVNGAINNCWSSNFKNYLLSARDVSNKKQANKKDIRVNRASKIIQSCQIYLKLGDLLFQTQLKQSASQKIQSSSTQAKIKDLLFYLDYQYRSNVLINGFQIDLLLIQTVLIQYNGFYHYRSNCDQLVPTVRQNWKRKCLEKRGFSYNSISFQQWDMLQTNIQQRNFLIDRIENIIINQIPQHK